MPHHPSSPGRSGPLGLYDRWPWLHVLIAVVLLTIAGTTWPWVRDHPRWLWFVFLAIPVLVLHEFEEYVLPGGFVAWFNTQLFGSRDPEFPLDRRLAAASQMPLMILFPVLAALGSRWPWIGLGGLIGLGLDGLFHATATAVYGRYSPGAVTGLLLYQSLAFGGTYYFVRTGQVTPAGLLGAVFGAIVVYNVVVFLPPRLLVERHPRRVAGGRPPAA